MKSSVSLLHISAAAGWTLATVATFTSPGLAAAEKVPPVPVTVQVLPPAWDSPPAVDVRPSPAASQKPVAAAPPPPPGLPRRKPGRFSQLIARLQLGVKPSYSTLLSAHSRKSFGNGGLSVRPSYFRLRVPVSHNELGWDYGFNRAKFNDNRMTMITVGAGYQHNFRVAADLSPDATDEEKAAWLASLGSYPYVGLGLNVVATKLQVPSENLDTNFKLGLGATVIAGYQIKRRMRMQGSVTGMTPVSGYNFSSMRVALDYKM